MSARTSHTTVWVQPTVRVLHRIHVSKCPFREIWRSEGRAVLGGHLVSVCTAPPERNVTVLFLKTHRCRKRKKVLKTRSSLLARRGRGQKFKFLRLACVFFWLIEAEGKVEPWQVKKLSVS